MFDINSQPPIYDPEAVQPMRDELIYVGFEEMNTPEKVDDILSTNSDETILLMINSVCGCGAGSARPGVTIALQNDKIPHRFVTSFAGNDRDAVDHLRSKYLSEFAPSSPSMAIFKNGELLFHMPRHEIQGQPPEAIAEVLINQFEKIDGKEGPSISKEAYYELTHATMCGSKIPLNKN